MQALSSDDLLTIAKLLSPVYRVIMAMSCKRFYLELKPITDRISYEAILAAEPESSWFLFMECGWIFQQCVPWPVKTKEDGRSVQAMREELETLSVAQHAVTAIVVTTLVAVIYRKTLQYTKRDVNGG